MLSDEQACEHRGPEPSDRVRSKGKLPFYCDTETAQHVEVATSSKYHYEIEQEQSSQRHLQGAKSSAWYLQEREGDCASVLPLKEREILLAETRKLAEEKSAAQMRVAQLENELMIRNLRVESLEKDNDHALNALETCREDVRRCKVDLDTFLKKTKKEMTKASRETVSGRELPWESNGPFIRTIADKITVEREKRMNLARKVKVWEQFCDVERGIEQVELQADEAHASVLHGQEVILSKVAQLLADETQKARQQLQEAQASLWYLTIERRADQARSQHSIMAHDDSLQRKLVTIQGIAASEAAALKKRMQEYTDTLAIARQEMEKSFKRRLEKAKENFENELRRKDAEKKIQENMLNTQRINAEAQMAQKHESNIREIQAKYEIQLKTLREELEISHKQSVQGIQEQHQADMEELGILFEERKEQARLDFHGQIIKLKASHERELSEKLEENFHEQASKHKQEITTLQNKHEDLISQMQKRYEQRLEQDRRKARQRETNIRAELNLQLDKKVKSHEDILRSIKSEHSAEMKSTLKGHAQELTNLHQKFATSLSKQAKEMEIAVGEARSQALLNAESSNLKDKQRIEHDFEERFTKNQETHQKNLNSILQRHQEDLKGLNAKIEELKHEKQDILDKLADADVRLNAVQQESSFTATRAQERYESKIIELEEQAALRTHSETLRMQKLHQEEISRLLVEHERESQQVKLESERRVKLLQREIELNVQTESLKERTRQEQRIDELQEQLRASEAALEAQKRRADEQFEKTQDQIGSRLEEAQVAYDAALTENLTNSFKVLTERLQQPPEAGLEANLHETLDSPTTMQSTLTAFIRRIEVLIRNQHNEWHEQKLVEQTKNLEQAFDKKAADLEMANHQTVTDLRDKVARLESELDIRVEVQRQALREVETRHSQRLKEYEAESEVRQHKADQKAQDLKQELATAQAQLISLQSDYEQNYVKKQEQQEEQQRLRDVLRKATDGQALAISEWKNNSERLQAAYNELLHRSEVSSRKHFDEYAALEKLVAEIRVRENNLHIELEELKNNSQATESKLCLELEVIRAEARSYQEKLEFELEKSREESQNRGEQHTLELEALAAEYQAKENEYVGKIDNMMIQITSKEDALALALESNKAELQTRESEHMRKLNDLRMEFEVREKDLCTEIQQVKSELANAQKAASESLIRQAEELTATFEKNLQAALADAVEQQSSSEEVLRENHNKVLAESKNQLEHKIKTLSTELSKVHAEYEETIQNVDSTYKNQISELKESLEKTTQAHQQDLEDQAQKFKQEKQRQTVAHEAALKAFCMSHDVERRLEIEELCESHDATIDVFRQQHEQELDRLHGEHDLLKSRLGPEPNEENERFSTAHPEQATLGYEDCNGESREEFSHEKDEIDQYEKLSEFEPGEAPRMTSKMSNNEQGHTGYAMDLEAYDDDYIFESKSSDAVKEVKESDDSTLTKREMKQTTKKGKHHFLKTSRSKLSSFGAGPAKKTAPLSSEERRSSTHAKNKCHPEGECHLDSVDDAVETEENNESDEDEDIEEDGSNNSSKPIRRRRYSLLLQADLRHHLAAKRQYAFDMIMGHRK